MLSLEEIIKYSLEEDIGGGDFTTYATIKKNQHGKMYLLVKEEGIIAGVEVAEKIYNFYDREVLMTKFLLDGSKVKPNDIVFQVEGRATSLLIVERTVLNFMQRMSGIATYVNSLVEKIKNFKTKITDTRKTMPLFRMLEKEAVRIGGGYNHRFGLYDMIMIKNNHITYAGGVKPALQRVHQYLKENNLNLEVIIEIRNLENLKEVMEVGNVDRVLFDNFDPETLSHAIKIVNGKFQTEASGGITEKNIVEYAKTNVDYISIGALTHHMKSLDLSLIAE